MFSSSYLKSFFYLSLAAVFILPTYVYFFLSPKFTGLIIENSEHEAKQVANHLVSMFFPDSKKFTKDFVYQVLVKNDKYLQKEFNLEKIKAFQANGEVIYSSEKKDIGKINTNSYFADVVGLGKLYSKITKMKKETLDGRIVSVDVVEICVPIMKDDWFVGALEIYLDISAINSRLSSLMARVYIVFFIISFILLLASVTLYYRAEKSMSQQKKLHEEQERNYDTEVVFNNLLQLSLVRTSLEELLENFIVNITSFPWLEVEPVGAIFLLDDDSDELVLKAQLGLNEAVLSSCARVPCREMCLRQNSCIRAGILF